MFNKAHFEQLLQRMLEKGASDLHLSSDEHPFFREDGRLVRQDDFYSTAAELEQVALDVLNVNQQVVFSQHQQVDVAIAYGNERYRVNIYRDRGNVSFAIRLLDNEFRSLEELNLPPQLDKFTQMKDGLVLVTGPTGSGKSTTLASIIDKINRTRADHIITVEDPIEYVHTNKKSLIHQRELYTDVQTFDGAVRAALREDPDVMLIGEMRDVETIRAAITAAETGHLVFSTLHTFTVLSYEPDTMDAPSGENDTEVTPNECPTIVIRHAPPAGSYVCVNGHHHPRPSGPGHARTVSNNASTSAS